MVASEMTPGERMDMQVMNLLSGVSSHGDQHLAEVERDLAQMDVLLGEAIKKLCASFMAIHQAVEKQQEAMGSMLSDDMSPSDYAARLETIQSEINRHVGAAVTGLQFQDMTSQLIGRMGQHLTGLREVFGELDAKEVFQADGSDEDLQEKLNRISDRIGERCSAQSGIRSSVSQRHMDSGDIELF